MVKAHMQAPKAKKIASNFNPIGIVLFIKRRFSAYSVSDSPRFLLIIQLALQPCAFDIFILPLLGLR